MYDSNIMYHCFKEQFAEIGKNKSDFFIVKRFKNQGDIL